MKAHTHLCRTAFHSLCPEAVLMAFPDTVTMLHHNDPEQNAILQSWEGTLFYSRGSLTYVNRIITICLNMAVRRRLLILLCPGFCRVTLCQRLSNIHKGQKGFNLSLTFFPLLLGVMYFSKCVNLFSSCLLWLLLVTHGPSSPHTPSYDFTRPPLVT